MSNYQQITGKDLKIATLNSVFGEVEVWSVPEHTTTDHFAALQGDEGKLTTFPAHFRAVCGEKEIEGDTIRDAVGNLYAKIADQHAWADAKAAGWEAGVEVTW